MKSRSFEIEYPFKEIDEYPRDPLGAIIYYIENQLRENYDLGKDGDLVISMEIKNRPTE